jgi:hypothetical protein
LKFSPDVTQTIVTFLTGGGLIALITTAVRGFRTIRTGALASTRAVVKDLVEARNEAEDRLDQATIERDFWRTVAGTYGYQLTSAGIVPKPANPQPPKATRATEQAGRDARRSRRDALEDSGDIFN